MRLRVRAARLDRRGKHTKARELRQRSAEHLKLALYLEAQRSSHGVVHDDDRDLLAYLTAGIEPMAVRST